MTDILIAFVIPIIAIILAIILETILRCPYKVAGLVFVILIITAFAFGGSLLYIALAWLYTILAYGVARIVERIILCCNNSNNINDSCGCNIVNNSENNVVSNNDNNINNNLDSNSVNNNNGVSIRCRCCRRR